MNTRLFDLTGRTALVTGSSQGLAFTIARGLGEAGANLILNGRNREKLQQAEADLFRKGLKVTGCAFDVSDPRQVKEKIPALEKEVGPIHILVNNAGIQRRSPLEEVDEAVWHEVLNTNLTAVFLVSQQVVQGMIARRSGKIINICSLMSEMARPTVGPYAAAKGGVKMLIKSMAVEWAPHKITVNAIGPGWFRTEMTDVLFQNPEWRDRILARHPLPE